MFWDGFGKKCIIMHFLGMGKNTGKHLNAVPNPEGSGSGAEAQRKNLRMWRLEIRRMAGWIGMGAQLAQAEAYAT
jgi:hypothetical protein